MRRRAEIMMAVDQVDLLADVKPEELAKEAKLGWLKRLLIIAVWPLIKPFIAQKIGNRLAEVLEDILDEI